MSTEPHWDHFEDARGFGVEGVGGTLASAFGEAARGLTALVTDLGKVELGEAVNIKIPGEDPQVLLVDWLNAVIAEMDARQMLFGDFEVYIGEGELAARVYGEPVAAHRHRPALKLRRARATEEVCRQDEETWIVRAVIEGERV